MTNLNKVRKDCGLTQAKIAEILEMEQTHYSKYELEKHSLPIDRNIKLALFYNVSIDYLCGMIDHPRTLTGIPYEDNCQLIKRAYSAKNRAGK